MTTSWKGSPFNTQETSGGIVPKWVAQVKADSFSGEWDRPTKKLRGPPSVARRASQFRAARLELLDCHRFHFFKSSKTLENFLDPVLHERRHPFCKGGIQHVFGARFLLNHALDVL